METDIDSVAVAEKNEGTRKRKRGRNKRQRQKELRYGDHLKDDFIQSFERPCNHSKKSLSCNNITNEDIVRARKKFFHVPDKIVQNRKLSQLLLVSTPKRRVSKYKPTARNQKHSKQIKYKMRKLDGKIVNVCQKFFTSCFGVTARRVHTIATYIKQGKDIEEGRGGDHKSAKNENKKIRVQQFIGSLRARESHYNRQKSKRLYLTPELSVAKLCKLYNEKNPVMTVNYGYFYKIFCTNFNIGFGRPATDVCSLCFRLKNKLQMFKKENKPIVPILSDLRIHKLRAKQFTLFMNTEVENSLSYCFDMQQIQPLPKLPIGEAYYLRQLSFYNFCITDLKCKTPVFYTWSENQAGRGANEVSSALGDFLSELQIPEFCTSLRFFADGCAGQNKNCYVIHALCFWLYHDAPENLNNITVIFPVRGHSFMPADRVFGLVEKKYRTQSVILHKESYEKILEEVGTVRKLGTEWDLYDVKKMSDDNCKKLTGISQMKRIFIKKERSAKTKNKVITVKMEENYRNNDPSKNFTTILKKGVQISNVELQELPLVNNIKELKLKNIDTLLKLYDEEWKSDEKFIFYKNLLDKETSASVNDSIAAENEDSEDEKNNCQCMEEDCGVKI